MPVLIWGLTFFAAAFILHFSIWKVRIPFRQTNALIAIFFSTLSLGLVLLFVSGNSIHLQNQFMPGSPFEYLHIALLSASLALAYIITYSALEVDSPSLSLILALNQAANGLTKEEISRIMTDQKLVIPRIKDLIRDKHITEERGLYRISKKGRNFILIFILYRNILGLGKGG